MALVTSTSTNPLAELLVTKYHEIAKDYESSEEALLDQVISTKGGKAALANHVASILATPTISPVVSTSGWKHTIYKVKSVSVGGVFYLQVSMEPNGEQGVNTGHVKSGGLYSPGAGVYWGTFWFNDANEINNDCAAQLNCTTTVMNINFFHPAGSGNQVGVYVGGGMSTNYGIGGGKWQPGAG